MQGNGTNGHPYVDVLIDATIAGGAAVTAVGSATAFGVVRADPPAFVYAAVVAFFVAFFASLGAAIKRSPVKSP